MSTLKTNTLSNVAGTQSIGVDRVAQGTAAAWVNFNGTGTIAIRAQYNVSSITDNGVGLYTVNFTTAMTDANYSFAGGGYSSAAGRQVISVGTQTTTQNTGSLAITTVALSGGANTISDSEIVCVSIFR